MPAEALNYSITDFNGVPAEIDDSIIEITFIAPSGTAQINFDNSVIGEWGYRIKYQQSQKILRIIVRDWVVPVITLKQSKIVITQNETITNLSDYILISTNSIEQNIKGQVFITSDTAIINNNCFMLGNSVGTHELFFQYLDPISGIAASAKLIVEVAVRNIEVMPDDERKLLVFEGPPSLNNYFSKMGSSLKSLISQINKLDKVSDYKFVLAASLRVVIHLLDVEYAQKTSGSSGDGLHKQLANLLGALTNDLKNGHIIKVKEAWINEDTLLDAFRALNSDKQWLIDVLNCASHSGADLLSDSELRSAGKKVSQILIYIAILLY